MAVGESRATRLVILGVRLLVVGLLIATLTAEDSCDPTEQSFTVTLRNDVGQAVVVQQCDARCNEIHEVDVLPVGHTVDVNTSDRNVDNWWMVKTRSGALLGCVDLLYDHKQDGVVVPLSRRKPCPM